MIDLIKKLIDFIIHIDRHLAEIIANYGVWTYAVLFLIIFAGLLYFTKKKVWANAH